MYWLILLLVSYVLQATGVASNVLLIRMVVCKSLFDPYCRIGLGIISVSIMGYLASNGAQTTICLATGSMFKNSSCVSKVLYISMNFLHTFSAILLFTSQDAFTIERIVSIRHPQFHGSARFRIVFSAVLAFVFFFSLTLAYFNDGGNPIFSQFYGITTQVLVFSNLPLMLYAQRYSRQMYQADVSNYNLARKHQLFNSYEITRSFVFALSINYIIQIFAVLLGIMFLKGHFFFPEGETYKMEFIIQTLWNVNHTIFPWSVILFHRGQRDKLVDVWKSIFPRSRLAKSRLTSLDGRQIVRNPTQNDYFQQMKVAWTEQKF